MRGFPGKYLPSESKGGGGGIAVSWEQNSLHSEIKKKKTITMNRNFTDAAFISGCQNLVFSVHI